MTPLQRLEERAERNTGESDRQGAWDKVLGRTKYTTDLVEEEALFVRVVRSPYPHASILRIDGEPAMGVRGVRMVITAKDVPGNNYTGYVVPDRPLLCHDRVRFVGDPVALVVAETPEAAQLGATSVKAEYSQLPALFNAADALRQGAPLIHPGGNVIARHLVSKGDVERGLNEADLVLSGTYRTPVQEHAYLETEAALAYTQDGPSVTVVGSMQNPFMVKKAVANVLGNKVRDVRIIQAPTGGGFGGKQDSPDEVCSFAALASFLSRRPTIVAFSREESVTFHPKRHPMTIRREMGVTSDGRITAVRAHILADGGAYASLSARVLFTSVTVAVGPYDVPNVLVDGTVVYTNKVPMGAFRGFGKPQAVFAAELQMDEAANSLGLDPIDFRLRNLLRVGSTTSTGQRLISGVSAEECLLRAKAASSWDSKRVQDHGQARRHGIGVACSIHPEGLLGEPDSATASVEINDRGEVVVRTGLTDYGQGTYAGFIRMVSRVLGLKSTRVIVARPDTALVPDTGPTVASRSTAFGGRAIIEAAQKLKLELSQVACDLLSCAPNEVAFQDDWVMYAGSPGNRVSFAELTAEGRRRSMSLKGQATVVKPVLFWDQAAGQGALSDSYSFAAHVAEVEVDTETGWVSVLNYTAAHDSGTVLAPDQFRSQITGGIAQGLGYALMEELVIDKGIILNKGFLDYHIPTASDVPPIKLVVIETHDNPGPFGAKGVGEAGIEPVAAAVANAIYDALGVPVRQFPFTAERIRAALQERLVNQ